MVSPPLPNASQTEESLRWTPTSSATPGLTSASNATALRADNHLSISSGIAGQSTQVVDRETVPSNLQGKSKGKGKGKETGKSKVKPVKKVHKCTYEGCNKTFITPAHVRRHLRTHTGLQPYPCEFCEKRFARSDVRNRHMQLSHRELYDVWLEEQPSERKRQDSRPPGQGRESGEGLEDTTAEDYGEGYNKDDDEQGDGADEEGAVDARDDPRNTFAFATSGYAMDVEVNPNSSQSSMNRVEATSTRASQNVQGCSSRLQHRNVGADDPLHDPALQIQSYSQLNTGANSAAHSHSDDGGYNQSTTNVTRAGGQVSFALSNSGLSLSLPHNDEHLTDSSYMRPQSRHPVDDAFGSSAHHSQYITSTQGHSHQGHGTQGTVLGSDRHAPLTDNPYPAISEIQRMEGARDNSGVLSRLDILLAAAAQPDQRMASGSNNAAGAQQWVTQQPSSTIAGVPHTRNNTSSVHDIQHQSGVHSGMPDSMNDIEMINSINSARGIPMLPFTQNNPNSSLTPEAFIASTLSLNSGTIASVVSGASPLDLYDMDMDMGLYHDVFGWGLGAADWQQHATTGHGPADAGAWTYDMLDLSVLNNPTEFIGRGSNSLATTSGALADFVASRFHGETTGVDPSQEIPSVEQGKHGVTNAVASMRASGRTTRHGTATPGNEEETPWPHVFRPSALPLERPLSLPYAIEISEDEYTSFLSSAATHQPLVSPSSRASILLLAKVCHGASPWREPDYTNFPSPQVLSHCVGLYFNHFHPILPILRSSAYRDAQGDYGASSTGTVQKEVPSTITSKPGNQSRDEAYHTLLTLTIAAIGATYAEDRLKPLGGYLMELARRIGSYLQLSDPRSLFSVPYIQSRLLIAVGGYADGSRERYLMSEISKGLLITAARRLHLLRERRARPRGAQHRTTENLSANDVSAARASNQKEIKRRWREWLDEEERLRLGWAIYIFDAQAAAFLNIPAAFSLNEIQVRLPGPEELWDLSNAGVWEETYRSWKGASERSRSSLFGTMLSTMLREGRLQEWVSDFGKWILAHSLYRMCDDANMQNKLMGYIEPTFPPLAESFSRPNQKNPILLIGSLVTSWQSEVSFARPSAFFASSNALRHYSNIRFIHPTFMDHVKLAAGKFSASASREGSQRWLTETPSDSVLRRIFVESIHLAVFLLHSRLDAPWEPVILLDCALALWAILRFRPEMLQLSATSPGATILRSGSRSTDYLEKWISDGGPLRIQGMSYVMTPENVLTDFITRLQGSPWGLSRLYAAVLNNLRPKEDAG